jgi:vitamin B12 transporter
MQGISRIALCAALATAGAGGARAQEATEEPELLGTITLTASTEALKLSETGASVSVLTEEDLKKSGELSVASQLARLPGVSMTRSGGLGTSTALRLRGLSGPYIGVRIDGIDVADTSGTQCAYDFGSTTLGGIGRIEVLRGSQSALYGSEAIGGVVDITSFRASGEGTEAKANVEAGSNKTYAGTVSVATKTERMELAFSASRTVTDGISAYALGSEPDAFRATTLTFYGSYDLTENVTVGLNGIWRDSHTEFDSQTSDNAESEEGELRGVRVFAQAETGAVTHELSFAHTETSRFYPLGFVQRYEGDRDQLAYKASWDISGQTSLNMGLDHTEESFDSDTDSGDVATTSAYGEFLYAPTGSLDLSLALRYDDHETFGGHTSGRAALAWRPSEDWVIRAVASTGFRAPSLYELYSAYGDPNLKPENSTNLELGAEYLFDNGGSLQATLFHTEIEDMIGFDSGAVACGSGFGCYNQVPGTTTTRGFELIGRTPIAPGWELFGNYTYTDAYSEDAGVRSVALRVPMHDLSLGVEGQISDRLSGLFTVQHVANFWDSGVWPAPASKMPDYTVANLTLTYEMNDITQAYLRVENIFDEDYQTVRNYGQPGRQVFVGVQASF